MLLGDLPGDAGEGLNQSRTVIRLHPDVVYGAFGAKEEAMNLFNTFAQRTASFMGSGPIFIAAVLLVAVWAITGPYFHYSESWQLVVNTGTNIITFWMVFVIQNTQNRDARTIHLKLDELIRSIKSAHNDMINLDQLTDEQLGHLENQFKKLPSTGDTMQADVTQTTHTAATQAPADG